MKGGRSIVAALRSPGSPAKTRDAALSAAAIKRHDADKITGFATGNTLTAARHNPAWHPGTVDGSLGSKHPNSLGLKTQARTRATEGIQLRCQDKGAIRALAFSAAQN